MNTDLTTEASEFGRMARLALESAGGDQLAPRAEADPTRRAALVDATFTELGAWELDPRGGADEAEAAAALCRSAGYWAVAYPVAERLSRPRDADVDGLLVVDPARPAARVGGLDLRWLAVGLDGIRHAARPRPTSLNPRKDAFVVPLDLEPIGGVADVSDAGLALVLIGWTLLGMLDRAVELTCQYVLEREQFGQTLSSFQGVQFQLTDAEVERVGLEEQLKYALWSIEDGRPEVLADALAARVAAVRAAEVVFRVAHQLHGAIGFCDETPISWLSRASLPIRRLPFGASATRAELLAVTGRRGLTGLFSTGA